MVFSNIEKTMAELDQEQPKITTDKRQISYENAVHPLHAKKALKDQPLIDLGSDIAHKSMNFVEKLFSDSSASNSDAETSSQHHKKHQTRRTHNHHDNYVPNDPSSLAQELPMPANLNNTLPARQEFGIHSEDARKEFDENLTTLISMFPNIEPDVCFMILQASEGKLPQTIER
jgi:hypothetical protein